MTNEPSPRPWRVIDNPNGQLVLYTSIVKNSDGRDVAFVCRSADAALIASAVNNVDSWRDAYIKARTERNAFLLERDRLRDIVRNAVETLNQVYKHADMTDALREVVAETQRDARAAIGAGETPTGKGVGR